MDEPDTTMPPSRTASMFSSKRQTRATCSQSEHSPVGFLSTDGTAARAGDPSRCRQ